MNKGVINQMNQGKILGFNAIMVKATLDHLDTKLFIKRSIGQLISGYNDPLMELAELMDNAQNDGKFSLLKNNGTEWQSYVINTGYSDPLNVGKIASWNGLKYYFFLNKITKNKFINLN